MEFGPNFKRVVGGQSDTREQLSRYVQQQAERTGEDLFGESLLDPTTEERTAIELVVETANKLTKQYGNGTVITAQRIFVLKSESPELVSKNGGTISGFYNSVKNVIAINRCSSPLLFAQILMHECLHATGYHSAQIKPDNSGGLYRSGIEMRGREGDYFHVAQEAIIAELSFYFVTNILSHHQDFQQEFEKIGRVKAWLHNRAKRNKKLTDEERLKVERFVDEILWLPHVDHIIQTLERSDKGADYKTSHILGWIDTEVQTGEIMRERLQERQKLSKVINRIVETANDPTITKDTVFDEFAKAHFTGNYMPLARLIESILGKGSFREIAIELGEMKQPLDR